MKTRFFLIISVVICTSCNGVKNRLSGNAYILKPVNTPLMLKLIGNLTTITHEYISIVKVHVVTYQGKDPIKSEELNYSIKGDKYYLDDEVYDLTFRNDTAVLSIQGSEYIQLVPVGNTSGTSTKNDAVDDTKDPVTSAFVEPIPTNDDKVVTLPPAPVNLAEPVMLATHNFVPENGIQKGIVYELNEKDGEQTLTVCYKGTMDTDQTDGYILLDMNVWDNFTDGIDKAIFCVGRRVEFQTEWIGGHYGHAAPVYLKPLPKDAVTISSPVTIDKHIYLINE